MSNIYMSVVMVTVANITYQYAHVIYETLRCFEKKSMIFIYSVHVDIGSHKIIVDTA